MARTLLPAHAAGIETAYVLAHRLELAAVTDIALDLEARRGLARREVAQRQAADRREVRHDRHLDVEGNDLADADEPERCVPLQPYAVDASDAAPPRDQRDASLGLAGRQPDGRRAHGVEALGERRPDLDDGQSLTALHAQGQAGLSRHADRQLRRRVEFRRDAPPGYGEHDVDAEGHEQATGEGHPHGPRPGAEERREQRQGQPGEGKQEGTRRGSHDYLGAGICWSNWVITEALLWPSISAPGASTTRWARQGIARRFTSSGVT